MKNIKDKINIIIGVLIIILLGRIISSGNLLNELLRLLLIIPGLLLSISVHEAAHAYMAYKLGDDTAKNEGRISLNPAKHIDPVGLLSLFIFKIGWGKPVEFNPRQIKVSDIKKAEAKIALAGPLSNIILALVVAIVLALITTLAPKTNVVTIISVILYNTFILSIGLGLFNLIPFPPLDGSKIFYKLYEGEFGRFVRRNEFILSIAFLFLIMSGTVSLILSPINELIQKIILNFVGIFFK